MAQIISALEHFSCRRGIRSEGDGADNARLWTLSVAKATSEAEGMAQIMRALERFSRRRSIKSKGDGADITRLKTFQLLKKQKKQRSKAMGMAQKMRLREMNEVKEECPLWNDPKEPSPMVHVMEWSKGTVPYGP